MSDRTHWNDVYRAREVEALTWYEAAPGLSLELIRLHARPGPAVDVGAGTSHLVDALLDAGFGPVTALDLSDEALAISRARLGERADEVNWVVGDVTRWRPEAGHSLWHDRAVLHFLTEEADRAAYVAALDLALAVGGVAVIGTFADDGPEKCSGLPVQRYSPEALLDELERHAPGKFAPVEARRHVHVTPMQNRQHFQFSVFRKRR